MKAAGKLKDKKAVIARSMIPFEVKPLDFLQTELKG